VPIKKGVKELVDEAINSIETVSTEEAINLLEDPDTLFVDIRDVRELDREGMIPNAFHAPRGMLEFWVDPKSPYYKDFFSSDKKTYLLYCQSAWRSALATKTLKNMGMENVKHFSDGFNGWKKAGGPVAQRKSKK